MGILGGGVAIGRIFISPTFPDSWVDPIISNFPSVTILDYDASDMDFLPIDGFLPIDVIIVDGPIALHNTGAAQLLALFAGPKVVGPDIEYDALSYLDMGVDHLIVQLFLLNKFMLKLEDQQAKTDKILVKLDQVQAIYDALDEDILRACELQKSFVQNRQLYWPTGNLSLCNQPRNQIGGDLVGHFPAGTSATGFFALDVSGHGLAAALLSARIAGMLLGGSVQANIALERTNGVLHARAPSETLAELNDLMFQTMETDQYFTCLIGYIEHDTGRVVYGQAGHPKPIILRNDGTADFVGDGGLPVGLVPGADYYNQELRLQSGDRLFIYSDGMCELPTIGPLQILGDAQLLDLLQTMPKRTGDPFFDQFLNALLQRTPRKQFHDDISALLMCHTGTPKYLETANLSPETARCDMAVTASS